MNVVVILPTYNERENILTVLDRLHQAAKHASRYKISYLVVDDSSPDGTSEIVRKYQEKHKDVYLITGSKQGLGRALLRGMTYAADQMKAEIIAQMDADLSHDPASLPDFLRALNNGADFVIGSRYIAGGSIPGNWGVIRKVYSIMANAIVRFGLGHLAIHDWTGGYRVYHKVYYEKAKSEMGEYRGYLFQIAFLNKAYKNGAHIVEVPIQFTDRLFGHSKIAPSEYIRDIFLYIISSRWKDFWSGHVGKFMVVGTIGFIINTLLLIAFVAMKMHPAIASALGAECAIISNFILNNNWTFHGRKISGERIAGKFLQFNLTSLGALGIQSVSVWIGVYLLGYNVYFLFYILGVGIGLIWNYLMYSRVIWKKNT